MVDVERLRELKDKLAFMKRRLDRNPCDIAANKDVPFYEEELNRLTEKMKCGRIYSMDEESDI